MTQCVFYNEIVTGYVAVSIYSEEFSVFPGICCVILSRPVVLCVTVPTSDGFE